MADSNTKMLFFETDSVFKLLFWKCGLKKIVYWVNKNENIQARFWKNYVALFPNPGGRHKHHCHSKTCLSVLQEGNIPQLPPVFFCFYSLMPECHGISLSVDSAMIRKRRSLNSQAKRLKTAKLPKLITRRKFHPMTSLLYTLAVGLRECVEIYEKARLQSTKNWDAWEV